MKDEYDFSKARRARKTAKNLKVIKTVRLDLEVLVWLEREGEKQGMGYQTYLNWFLLQAVHRRQSLEERVSKLEEALFKKKD
jgi:uncharacterized protein (DUF4415 family)